MTAPAKPYRYDAFLSYRHAEPDQAFARDLLRRLESAGLRVAIDERDFRPEATFLEEMERCIRESRFTLAVLSPRYLASGNALEEAILSKVLDMAERRRRLVPLILEPVERPIWIYDIVGVDFSDPASLVEPFDRLSAMFSRDPSEPERPSLRPPGGAGPQGPRGELTRALEAAYLREEETLSQGGDAQAVQAEILDLRRQLREGGRLAAGDFLAGGRFKLLEPLGKGGFATVWKAFDRKERTPVAIKVLHGQFVDDRTRLDRFFRGARKMAELEHPGIVRVRQRRLDDGGFHFFVMEYVGGGDLREAVLGGKVPRERVVPLIQEVAAALQHAHDRGIVHRDVKPANVLLDAAGRPKLTDFDLVQAGDTTGGTMAGAMLGTLLYSAPEAMDHPEEAGVAADVYSLAMTAAFCFSGRDLPREVLRDAPSFARGLPVPGGLREALAKAVAWEAEARFSAVRDFVQALEEGLAAPVRAPAAEPERLERLPSQPRADPEAPSPGAGDRSRKGKAGEPLEERLRAALAEARRSKRSKAVLQTVKAVLPVDREDVTALGLASWALDYSPGRSGARAERQAARRLRDRLWQLFRKATPAPKVEAGDRDWTSIPGGSFEMGSKSGGLSDERPAHSVTLAPFRMLVHTVTNREYRRFQPSLSGADDLPMADIDWFSAYAYCAWLGGRLPTEAEWEYAARAGTSFEYSDRNGRETTLEKVGWYDDNSGGRPHPVELLEPNLWGLYDMIGNVREWVGDWYAPYAAGPQADPWGPPCGGGRVLRGGCFSFGPFGSRAACRDGWYPGIGYMLRGFRVVLSGSPELGP